MIVRGWTRGWVRGWVEINMRTSLERLPESPISHQWGHHVPAVTIVLPMHRRTQYTSAFIREVLVDLTMFVVTTSQLLPRFFLEGMKHLLSVWFGFRQASGLCHKVMQKNCLQTASIE